MAKLEEKDVVKNEVTNSGVSVKDLQVINILKDLEETLYYHGKYIDILLNKCIETAKRCNSVLLILNLVQIRTLRYNNLR